MTVLNIHSKNIFSSISFQGALQHKLSKSLYSKDEINEMLGDFSKEERYVGSLPPSWVKNFSSDEIGIKTKKAFEIFSEFAESVYQLEDSRYDVLEKRMRELEFDIYVLQGKKMPKDIIEEKCKEYEECLEKLLNKYESEDYHIYCKQLSAELSELINKKCDVEYENAGIHGVTFKLSADEEEYLLKVYKPLYSETLRHGRTVEPANAIYLNRIMKPERCTKFYCGKIASDNENDGFMLTKYKKLDVCDAQKMNDILKWIKNTDMFSNRFRFTDVKPSDPVNGNFINGTLVDFGGIEFTCKSAKEYKLMKQLYQAVKSGDTETIRKIKEEHYGSKEFENCMKRILSYSESFSNQEFMMMHNKVYFKPTGKMIKGFRELGINL